ncbi:restriction endonuclease subunit S [Sulfuricurvum sp.]|uniref:restriction endonuclease subunit S n=1 Tax=Sulfuricurvum sp. TaxID=2025608 RepID=UPI00356AED87
MKQGWEVKKLGDVVEIRNGKNQQQVLSETGQYPIMGSAGNIMGFATDYICEAGTTIIGRKGNINKPIFINERFWNVDTAFGFYPKNELEKKFLYYLCLNIDFGKMNRGTTIPSLVKSELQKIQIPFPPLSEQQKIVAILDEAFAAIERAKANAVQNLKNAKELFDSYLQSVFENRGEGWKNVKLSELTTDITDGDHMPPPKTETGIPFITISNINKKNYQIDFSDTFTVSIDYYQKLKINRKPKKGDILYTVTGSYGIPVLVEDNVEFCFQRHIGLIRPKENTSSKWLFYWVLSPQAFKQANETATGTAQKTVSLTALRNFSIPKISLSEQQTIVQKLDALSAETKRLEAIYQQKIDNLEELKKSILQKAFNGEL